MRNSKKILDYSLQASKLAREEAEIDPTAAGQGEGGGTVVPPNPEEPLPVINATGFSDDAMETDIGTGGEDLAAQVRDSQEVEAAQEALDSYASQIRVLIATESCTETTAKLLEMGIGFQMARLHMDNSKVNVESLSVGANIVEVHQAMLNELATENVFLNDIAQHYVVSFKHHWNAVADFMRTTSSKLKKYEAKVQAGKAEFERASKKMGNKPIEGSLSELWYHFSTDAGQVKDIVKAVKDDLNFSSYVLTTYPKKVMDTANKVVNILKSADFSTVDGIEKTVKAVEALPSGAELFDKKFMKQSYLGVTTLTNDAGTQRKPITIKGTPHAKLAELATPNAVVETGSLKHSAKKVGSYVGGAYAGAITGGVAAHFAGNVVGNAVKVATHGAMAAFTARVKMSSQDLSNLIGDAETYLKNVRSYLELENSLEHLEQQVSDALKRVGQAEPDHEAAEVAKQALKQIDQYLTNLVCENFARPAVQEIQRSIKTSKYIMYMAHRLMFNAG